MELKVVLKSVEIQMGSKWISRSACCVLRCWQLVACCPPAPLARVLRVMRVARYAAGARSAGGRRDTKRNHSSVVLITEAGELRTPRAFSAHKRAARF
jgi:hypothetical protein